MQVGWTCCGWKNLVLLLLFHFSTPAFCTTFWSSRFWNAMSGSTEMFPPQECCTFWCMQEQDCKIESNRKPCGLAHWLKGWSLPAEGKGHWKLTGKTRNQAYYQPAVEKPRVKRERQTYRFNRRLAQFSKHKFNQGRPAHAQPF